MDLCCFADSAESADGAVDLTRDARGAGVRVDEDAVLVEVAYGRLPGGPYLNDVYMRRGREGVPQMQM